MSDQSLIQSLALDSWGYAEFFHPQVPAGAIDGKTISDEIDLLVDAASLEEHPFFARAAVDNAALKLWVSQELVMTNAFSQMVLYAASRVHNVHARAILVEVAVGEHGRFRSGSAVKSHPWLLHQLRESIGLSPSEVSPMTATIGFIDRLAGSLEDPLAAIAYLGVGNERLIVPEYQAIERCFGIRYPTANFTPFLQANLTEDIRHSQLCFDLAAMSIDTEDDHRRFLSESSKAIESRVDYFSELLSSIDRPLDRS